MSTPCIIGTGTHSRKTAPMGVGGGVPWIPNCGVIDVLQ